jgi:hypothetical protein
MRRIAAALLATLVLTAPQALARKPYVLPSYLVVVKLSPKAEAQLSEEKVKVHIGAHYYGIAKDDGSGTGDPNAEVALGDEQADVDGSSAAVFGRASFNTRDLAKVVDGSVRVHVTVTAGKKLLSGSEITCTEFKDYLPTTALPRIPISCKLADE